MIHFQNANGDDTGVSPSNPLPTITQSGGEYNPNAQVVTVANTSHANNTMIGTVQEFTVANGVANGGFTLCNIAVRSASGDTGQVGLFVFHSQPAGIAAIADGGAFAMSAADLAKAVPGLNFNVTPAAMPGGITQTGANSSVSPAPFRLDADKKFYVALVNTSGGAKTYAENDFAIAVNGYANTY